MLRIVGGQARGCRLEPPPSCVVRPPTDRIRASLFTVLDAELEGARILDAFAGTGVMGLEALSRGARHCTFVERDRDALDVLARNIRTVGFLSRTDVRAQDLREKLSLAQCVDLAFIDPPFALFAEPDGRAFLKELLADFCTRLVRPGGRLILRHEEKHAIEAEEVLAGLDVARDRPRVYGRSVVKILVRVSAR